MRGLADAATLRRRHPTPQDVEKARSRQTTYVVQNGRQSSRAPFGDEAGNSAIAHIHGLDGGSGVLETTCPLAADPSSNLSIDTC